MLRLSTLAATAMAGSVTGVATPRGQGAGAIATAQASAKLSTAGDYLSWSDEESRYWFFSAGDGLDRFRTLAFRHQNDSGFSEIARSATGWPVYSFRIGNGPKPVVLISGMHGCEPSGPRGLLAFLDALLDGRQPFGVSLEKSRLLKAMTLHVIPLINPGGAQRFSTHFPDSWHGTWIPEWTEPNKVRFMSEGNQPNEFFYGTYIKKAPMRFTPDQIARWEGTGYVLGSSLTDEGLDMWFDWDDTRGLETAGLKQLLRGVRPYCLVDFHNFMFPTEVFAPTAYSEGSLAQEEAALGVAIQQAWRGRKLQFHDAPPRSYPKPKEKYYEDYWLHELGARILIIEFNGGMLATEGAEYVALPGTRPLSRRESLESAVVAASAVVNHIVL
jgi:hypothetical protein